METENIDKLFLELSQFTTAKTKREIELEAKNKEHIQTILVQIRVISELETKCGEKGQ